MHLVIYSSQLTKTTESVDSMLQSIIYLAKERNSKLDVTGLLFYHNVQFLQILEGKKENLDNLMALISKDSRHHSIEILVNEKIRERSFKDWNMDSLNLSSNQEIDPDELKKVIAAYRKVAKVDSETLITFLKLLLSHDRDK